MKLQATKGKSAAYWLHLLDKRPNSTQGGNIMCPTDNLKLLAPLISFTVIGMGFFTGANLLLRLLGYEPEKSHLLDIGALSVFI